VQHERVGITPEYRGSAISGVSQSNIESASRYGLQKRLDALEARQRYDPR
jgi:hypothetical protein